jgi:hypothetical protein
MRKYKVREGSIADWARVVITGTTFWGILVAITAVAYGMV